MLRSSALSCPTRLVWGFGQCTYTSLLSTATCSPSKRAFPTSSWCHSSGAMGADFLYKRWSATCLRRGPGAHDGVQGGRQQPWCGGRRRRRRLQRLLRRIVRGGRGAAGLRAHLSPTLHLRVVPLEANMPAVGEFLFFNLFLINILIIAIPKNIFRSDPFGDTSPAGVTKQRCRANACGATTSAMLDGFSDVKKLIAPLPVA